MVKKILIVSALSAELKIVKEEIKKLNIFKNDLEISFFVSWMWNYKTILNLTGFLKENIFDFIVNIGVCWYKSPHPHPNPLPWRGEGIEQVIQIWRIKNLSNSKELIIPNFIEFSKIESIASSEKIIYDEKEIWEENFVDMESFWFEMVSEKYNLPRIILKIPVDKIGEETESFDFLKAKKYLKENIDYEKLILEINRYLKKNNSNEIWKEIKEKILKNYKWTFSEKIILDKLINKIIVLELWNLEDFSEENKQLNKKEFFKKLNKLW